MWGILGEFVDTAGPVSGYMRMGLTLCVAAAKGSKKI